MPSITVEVDSEMLRWVEAEHKRRSLGKVLGGSIPSAEDKIIMAIHTATKQPVFDKARNPE